MFLFEFFSILVSLSLCSSSIPNYIRNREYNLVGSLSSAKSELALLMFSLIERRTVDEFAPFLRSFPNSRHSSSSALKTLINFKFEIKDKELSFMDLLETEGHLYLVLAKHKKSFPLLNDIMISLGNASKNFSSQKQVALYELILRFPLIYKNMPASTSNEDAIKTFTLLVDYATGVDIIPDRLSTVRGFDEPFFVSLLDYEPISFSYEKIDSYLKLLAYSQSEIGCIFWMYSGSGVKTQSKGLTSSICEEIEGILSNFRDYSSFERIVDLTIFYYTKLVNGGNYSFFGIRRIKFFKFYRYLKHIPKLAMEILFKYYTCAAIEMKSSDVQMIIDLNADQREIIKNWQQSALGHYDALSDPENSDKDRLSLRV